MSAIAYILFALFAITLTAEMIKFASMAQNDQTCITYDETIDYYEYGICSDRKDNQQTTELSLNILL